MRVVQSWAYLPTDRGRETEMTKEQKDIRDTIALDILKARIQNGGIADPDGDDSQDGIRMDVNDAFVYANEFVKQSNEPQEPYDWDGTEEDRTVNRDK